MKKIYIFILLFVSSILSATEYYLEKYDVTVIDETYSSSGDGVYYFSCSDPDVNQNTAASTIYTDTYINAIELLWSRSELSECLYEKPDCTPEPFPDGKLTVVSGLTSDICDDYVLEGIYFDESTGIYFDSLQCWTDSCSDSLDNVTLFGTVTDAPCIPLSDVISSVPESDCSGLFTNWTDGYKGTLAFNSCDNICYVLEALPISCEDGLSYFSSQCDPILNNLRLTCDDSSTFYKIDYSCTPRNEELITSPCDPVFTSKKEECDSLNKAIDGKCEDNGVIVTLNTLECIDIVPDCSTKWHEFLNTTTNECECVEGYVRNTFGDCWIPLFPDDTNLTDEQEAEQAKAEQDYSTSKTQDETNTLTNDSLGDLNDKLDSANNALSGIRSDLNTTNNLLGSISDLLSGDSSSSTSSYTEDAGQKSNRDSINSGLSDIYGLMDSIKGDYENFQSVLENGLPDPVLNSGENPEFCGVVFGETVCLNLCDAFSTFRSIFYFIFTTVFMLVALRIYWSAFKR